MTFKKAFILSLFTLLFACEKDQICLEENTPYLIIRFYDIDNPAEDKPVPFLKVQVEGVEGDYTNETITNATDSIAIPIRAGMDKTSYKLTINGSDDSPDNDNTDILEIQYTREDVFVSRSCGYKTIFHDVDITTDGLGAVWMQSVKPVLIPLNITNEKAAHVKVFY